MSSQTLRVSLVLAQEKRPKLSGHLEWNFLRSFSVRFGVWQVFVAKNAEL